MLSLSHSEYVVVAAAAVVPASSSTMKQKENGCSDSSRIGSDSKTESNTFFSPFTSRLKSKHHINLERKLGGSPTAPGP